MKLTQLTATAAFAATLVKGWDTRYPLTASRCKFMDTFNPETIVRFFRSQEPECHSYDESGGHWLEHGHCQTFDYPFSSYWYFVNDGLWGNDDDYRDCRCYVMVYPEKHCKGEPVYCTGPVYDSNDWCIDLTGYPQGHSAAVHCDDDTGTIKRQECMASPLLQYMWGNDVPTDD